MYSLDPVQRASVSKILLSVGLHYAPDDISDISVSFSFPNAIVSSGVPDTKKVWVLEIGGRASGITEEQYVAIRSGLEVANIPQSSARRDR